MILLAQPWVADPSVTMRTLGLKLGGFLGGVVLLCCGGYRGFMWLFYDRHAHRRVNKRRSA